MNSYLLKIARLSVIFICCFFVFGCIQKNQAITKVPACQLPPDNLTETDFVGTWIAGYRGGVGIDKLEIRADGTYKQTYASQIIQVETDWLNWWLERRPSGFLFLHFEGMHRCDGFESICSRPFGGMEEETFNTCEGGFLTMTDEVTLTVIGSNFPVPKGIELLHAKFLGSDWNYSFRFDDTSNP